MGDAANDRGQYIVVARRYRPQGFGDLIGQAMVSQALRKAIETDRVGHAYLFTGARGVGKTSTARIMSKALNCVNGPSETPCHTCDICESIAAGDDVDVLEIDGASNRGIDEIRQLRSNISVRPSRSRFKIYIIDEVHMLTKEAFNALLKTLEEPPEHVKFIFCTTDPEKIPITVLSRCQRFDFAPVSADEIVERLEHIVLAEGAVADAEALKLLARKAAGSVRDSQSLLEQLLSFTTERITVEAVHAMLGTAGSERLYGVVSELARRDAAGALRELDRAIGDGVDAGQLTEQLLGCVRDLLALSVGGDRRFLLHSPEGDVERLTEVAEAWGTHNLLAAAQIIDQALARMRLVTHSRVLLEMALIRIANLEDLCVLTDLISQVQAGDPPFAPSKKKTPPVVKEARSERVVVSSEVMANAANVLRVDPPRGGAKKPAEAVVQPDESESAEMESVREVSLSELNAAQTPGDRAVPLGAEQIWRKMITQLDGMAADCASHFASIANIAPNRLVVTFPSMYTSSKSFCERPERQSEIERIVSKIAGKKLKLEFALEARTEKGPETPVENAISARQREREITQRPFVQRAVELFSADVAGVNNPKRSDK